MLFVVGKNKISKCHASCRVTTFCISVKCIQKQSHNTLNSVTHSSQKITTTQVDASKGPLSSGPDPSTEFRLSTLLDIVVEIDDALEGVGIRTGGAALFISG